MFFNLKSAVILENELIDFTLHLKIISLQSSISSSLLKYSNLFSNLLKKLLLLIVEYEFCHLDNY